MKPIERPDRFRSFIIIGAPGAGKGTQGAILGQIPRFYHFSMGAALRPRLAYPDSLRTDSNADQPPVKVLDDILRIILANPEWQEFAGA